MAGLPRSDWQMFIDGEWTTSLSGLTYQVLDPAEQNKIASVSVAAREDADRAITVADRSFRDERWRQMPDSERARVLWGVGERLIQGVDEYAYIETVNSGMPLRISRHSVLEAGRTFQYYAGWVDKFFGRQRNLKLPGGEFVTTVKYSPVGVAGLITPWNAPLRLAAVKIAPALAAGCSVVIKPADETPLTTLLLAEAAVEAGLPAGVLNVITGGGAETGRGIVENPIVRKVSFTGSTATARDILKRVSTDFTRVTLELGGKSPFIVTEQADLDAAIPAAARAVFNNSGQVCTAGSRLLVHSSVHDAVVEGVAEIAAGLKLGSGLDESSDLGPLVSQRQWEHVDSYVELARSEGATVRQGATLPDEGPYYAPTVISGIDPSSRVYQEEIFGPVVVVEPFNDVDEAIDMANRTEYGLAASVWSMDLGEAEYIADRLEVGRVGINIHGIPDVTVPSGGMKSSGWGRESGIEGLMEFVQSTTTFRPVRRS